MGPLGRVDDLAVGSVSFKDSNVVPPLWLKIFSITAACWLRGTNGFLLLNIQVLHISDILAAQKLIANGDQVQ